MERAARKILLVETNSAKREQLLELCRAPLAGPLADKSDDEEGNDIESFLFGTLGLDKPEDIDENGEASYSVRQYVKAAATVGSMIAMLI